MLKCGRIFSRKSLVSFSFTKMAFFANEYSCLFIEVKFLQIFVRREKNTDCMPFCPFMFKIRPQGGEISEVRGLG
jgi:hypothetical protein